MYIYGKLRGRIREKLGTEKVFAEKMKLSAASISAKLNGEIDFTTKEIANAVGVLSLEKNDIPEYFFSEQSQI